MKILNLAVTPETLSPLGSQSWFHFAAAAALIQLTESEATAEQKFIQLKMLSPAALEYEILNAGDVEETFLYLIGFTPEEIQPVADWAKDKGQIFSAHIAAALTTPQSMKSMRLEDYGLHGLVFPWFKDTKSFLEYLTGTDQKPDRLASRQAEIADAIMRSPA